jgi:hypothetical protein
MEQPVNRLELRWEPPLAQYYTAAPGQVFRLELRVDGRQLVPYPDQDYCFDLGELVRSLTCECGVPGCVGIEEGVVVTHLGDYITWQLTDPVTLMLHFRRYDYLAAISTVRKQVVALLHKSGAVLHGGDLQLVPFPTWDLSQLADE